MARAAAFSVLLLGALVLVGWALDVEGLKRVRPGYEAMAPLTALGFVVAGSALLLLRSIETTHGPLWLARALAAAVATIGAATLALSFLLSGLALLLLAVRVPRRYVTSNLLALATAFFALQALVGYVYDVEAFYGFALVRPMALHTALGFLLLGLGILLVRPGRGFMRIVTADDLGGYVARRLVPAAVLIPFLLGLVRILGVDAGIFGVVYGLALVMVLSMVVFVAIVWWIAAALGRVDAERAAADAERRRALAAAEAAHGYLAAVLDQMPAGVILAETGTGKLILGNRQVEAVWRHPYIQAETVAEYRGYRGFHPDGRPYEPEEWPLARTITTGEVVDGEEIEILRGDGTRALIRVSSAPVRGPGGEAIAAVVTFFDVTEERRAQAERAAANARLAAIVENSDDAIIGKTLDGTITSWNRAAERVYGYTAEEAIGRNISMLVAPEIDNDVPVILERLRRGERIEHYETRRLTKDGRRLDVSLTISPIRDGRGRLIGAATIARDVTERKRAEAERERLLERQRRARTDAEAARREADAARQEAERRAHEEAALRRAAQAVTASYTTQDVIRQVAESALRATEADGAFVLRLDSDAREIHVVASSGEHVPPFGEGLPYAGSATALVIEGNRPMSFPEVSAAEGPVPDELRIHCPRCAALIVPLKDSGVPIGSLVLVRSPERTPFRTDEVERAGVFAHLASLAFRKIHLLEEAERRRKELQDLLDSRGRLMRGFSHDVKNPLGAADGQLSLLEEGALEGLAPKQRDSVARARRSVRSAIRLIDNLVDLARAEAGRIEIERAPTDVRGIAHEISEEYRAAAEAKGLGLDVRLPDTLPVIQSDADRIRQILGNLIVNAVKYTDRGRIAVRIEEREGDGAPGPGRWIAVDVADTGPGIPPEKHEEIFGEFARLEPGTGRGVGLGLAISRRLARLLGGDVTLSSEVGRGSTFTLWLPPSRPRTAAERRAADGGARKSAGRSTGPGEQAPDRRGERWAREALAASEARFRALTENAAVGVFVIDEGSRIEYVNAAGARLFGYTADELIGRSLTVLMPEDQRARHRSAIRRYLETGQHHIPWEGVELPGLTKDGRVIPVEVSFGEFEREGKRHFTGFVRDISDRKAAEHERERLLASQRLLADVSITLAATLDYERVLQDLVRIVAERIADWSVVYVHDGRNGRLRRVAGAHRDAAKRPLMEEFLRYDVDPAAGAPVPEVFRTGRSTLMPRVSEEAIQAITAHDPEHARIVRDLGTHSAMAVPLVARGRTLGVLAVVASESGRTYGAEDLELAEELGRRAALVIDNARLYQVAEAASQAKSDFLAVMSHELRTPLTAIIGYEELLHGGLAGPLTADQEGYLRRIRLSALHLRELIEEILTFSRLESGREEVHLERTDIALLARETADVVEPAAREKGLRLHVDLPDAPVEVETDPPKVRRILLNLLNNSVSFTNRGWIRIGLEHRDGAVAFRVADTGIGIAPEAVERIFEPFWQEERGLTREVAGTGLGLTVARRLARMLGGDVTVRSRLGVGSTFTVTIPAGRK